jgi:hypothetical protein
MLYFFLVYVNTAWLSYILSLLNISTGDSEFYSSSVYFQFLFNSLTVSVSNLCGLLAYISTCSYFYHKLDNVILFFFTSNIMFHLQFCVIILSLSWYLFFCISYQDWGYFDI